MRAHHRGGDGREARERRLCVLPERRDGHDAGEVERIGRGDRVAQLRHVRRRRAAAVEAMRALHARPDRIYAVVGPGICPEHYEVPAPMRDEVEAAAPESAATTSAGTPALDIRSGLLAQLHDAGLQQWMVMPHCTAETSRYYSYRRDGITGRFAGVVWRDQ